MSKYNFTCPYRTEWTKYARIIHTEFAIIVLLNGWTILPGVLLNVVVLYSIWRTPSLHTPAMVLLFNLALSDLTVALLAQPVFIHWAFIELSVDEETTLFCAYGILSKILTSLLGGVSVASLTAVALDRFLALYLHLKYEVYVTRGRVAVCCVIFWMGPLFVACSWLYLGDMPYKAIVTFAISTCTCLTVLCYVKIYKTLKKHQAQILAITVNQPTASAINMSQYKKSVMGSLCVYLVFLVTYIPTLVTMAYTETTNDTYWPSKLLRMSAVAFLINSALNPLIYCWNLPALRLAVRTTLRKIWAYGMLCRTPS